MRGKTALALIPAILALLVAQPALSTEIMPPPDSPLLEAVKKGAVHEVKAILAGATGSSGINEKGNYGYTPLATAARNGNVEIVRLLAEHGAAIDGEKGDEARTPLMEASSYGHVEVAEYLISKGADVNARRKGLTPLLAACDHFSIQFGPVGDKKKTVYLLLDHGADVNIQDESWLKSGMTPLMFAVARGDADLVQALLAKEARKDTQNSKGETALSLARKEGLDYIVQLLEGTAGIPDGSPQQAETSPDPLIAAIKQGNLDAVKALAAQGADVNARTRSGSTPLMYAADRNRPAIARFLINKGADVNAKNGTNDTALIHASVKGNVKVAQVLLQSKAEVNIKNINGGDALIYAILNKHIEIVKLLLTGGVKVDERYDDGKTALLIAIEEGDFRTAGLLLAKGADANAQDAEQKTALIYACEKADLGTVKALVGKGARINERSKNGDTALDAAILNKHAPLVRFLIDKGADFKSTGALNSAVLTGSEVLVRMLKEKGADVNERGPDRKTPLMYAAAGEPGLVKYLLSQGADVNARDADGKTALMAAVDSFNKAKLQTVKLLLANRADSNPADEKGETALIMAARRGEAGIVRILLEKGSKVGAQDKQGRTAWIYAFQGGHAAVTGLLEKKGAVKAYGGITWEGSSSDQKEKLVTVITDREEWSALWKRAFHKAAPDMDFENYAAACVFLGHSAPWLYSIQFGTPEEHGIRLVIPYALLDVELKISGPFSAGGQYKIMIFEEPKGLEMLLEDTTGKPGT